MINYTYKSLFNDDSVHKSLVITFDDANATVFENDEIHEESLTLREGIVSGNQLVFGEVIANEFSFTVANKTQNSLKGCLFTVDLVLAEHTELPFRVGTYRVIEDELSGDRLYRNITGCDVLYDVINTNVAEWYNGLFPAESSTVTIAEMRASLANHFNFTEVTQELINDDMVVEKTIFANDLSGRDVLYWICELNGVFPHISRDNELKYISLGVVNSSPYEISVYKDVLYKDYISNAITKLQIRQNENDIGVIVGDTDSNIYVVQDNALVYGKSTEELTEIAENLYSVISIPWYKPYELSVRANLCLEVGDNVKITAKDGTVIYSYVLNRVANGIQAIFDELGAEGKEYQEQELNGYTGDFRALKGKSNELERSIEQTRSTITDVEQGLQTQITQNANGITAEITERENAVTDLNARITATSDSFSVQIQYLQDEIDGNTTTYYVSETPTLTNYPAWDWCTNIPVNGTVQLTENGVPFIYTEADYQAHSRSLAYDEANVTSYRFRKTNDVWGWVVIGDSDYTHVLQQLSELEVAQEGITARVNTIETNTYSKSEADTKISISAQGVLSTVSQTYTTKSETQGVVADYTSKFSQTASEISAKVSQTGGTPSSFAWSLTSNAFVLTSGNTEVFRCNSSGITINGYAKSNELYALSLEVDGKATISDLNAVSGRIDTLSSIAITTQNLSAQNINANQITAGRISTNYLDTDVLSASNFATYISSKVVNCNAINCTNVSANSVFIGNDQLIKSTIVIGGVSRNIVTWG